MKFINFLICTFSTLVYVSNSTDLTNCTDLSINLNKHLTTNCVSFTISSGTGCQWMCSYCANSLGTNNYYFTDNVCSYQSGGCVGNPQSGKTYTCCSV